MSPRGDHQNDSTERVLKVVAWLSVSSSCARPSKRLDRASTERSHNAQIPGVEVWDHQNDSTERVLKELQIFSTLPKSKTIKTTRQSEY